MFEGKSWVAFGCTSSTISIFIVGSEYYILCSVGEMQMPLSKLSLRP